MGNHPKLRRQPYQSKYGINKAIQEIARGKYIAIHHSDDAWLPDKLEKQVAYLDSNPNVGAVFSWAQIVDDSGLPFQDEDHSYSHIFEQPDRTRYEWLNYFFYKGNALCHPSVLIRKTVYDDIGLYRYGMVQLPDFDMWVRLAMKYEIHIMPEKLVRFRIHKNESNSSGDRPDTRTRFQFEYLQVLQNYKEILSFSELKKVFPIVKKYKRDGKEDLGFPLQSSLG
jgi:glycosyltransferase involved in cell wall biosynthesis